MSRFVEVWCASDAPVQMGKGKNTSHCPVFSLNNDMTFYDGSWCSSTDLPLRCFVFFQKRFRKSKCSLHLSHRKAPVHSHHGTLRKQNDIVYPQFNTLWHQFHILFMWNQWYLTFIKYLLYFYQGKLYCDVICIILSPSPTPNPSSMYWINDFIFILCF